MSYAEREGKKTFHPGLRPGREAARSLPCGHPAPVPRGPGGCLGDTLGPRPECGTRGGTRPCTLITSSSADRHSTDRDTSTTAPSSWMATTLTGRDTAFPGAGPCSAPPCPAGAQRASQRTAPRCRALPGVTASAWRSPARPAPRLRPASCLHFHVRARPPCAARPRLWFRAPPPPPGTTPPSPRLRPRSGADPAAGCTLALMASQGVLGSVCII